jgi:hypothetical protein
MLPTLFQLQAAQHLCEVEEEQIRDGEPRRSIKKKWAFSIYSSKRRDTHLGRVVRSTL